MGTDALVLFFPTYLTGFLFSQVALHLRSSSSLSSVSITCLFLVQVIKLLASNCKLSLLQGKSTLTNSSFSSLPSESKSPLYSTT